MNEDTIKAVAAYFTGPDVGYYSIGLAMHASTETNARAKRFFDTRTVLRIRGYDTEEEAARAIKRTLSR